MDQQVTARDHTTKNQCLQGYYESGVHRPSTT